MDLFDIIGQATPIVILVKQHLYTLIVQIKIIWHKSIRKTSV